MSTTVDQRVVEMRFDNKQFESNVSQTMSSLDKLKQSLNLTGATKGLENVGEAARKTDISHLGQAVETVGLKFNAMYTIADQALRNITNSAMNAGKKIISALTIDPVKTGFSEYETKIGAIQTILSNTSSKGTTMEDVTRVIGELNTYADKTIYNFAEMTRNIGTFTAAGIGLEDSATSIQGIANLAAASGSTSQQASTAMYQLSQALASGTVKLMDWNSVVNAGMGGQKFQDALKATAREYGVDVDSMIEKNGSFRESLQEGWITADILSTTLKKFTVEGAKEYGKSMMESGKWTQEEVDALVAYAQEMEDAATKVKTFTQLWDTLKESAQSGWAQTWEIIVGDFEEAKETLTKISDVIGGIINKSAEARNKLLQGWKDAGGRADLVDSLFNIIEAAISFAKPIKEAFNEIFPPLTVEKLTNFTKSLKELTAKMKLSDSTSDKLKRTFKGLFAVIDIVRQVFVAVFKAVGSLFGTVGDLSGGILGLTAKFGDWLVKLNGVITKSGIFSKTLQGVAATIKIVVDIAKKLFGFLNKNFIAPGFEILHSVLSGIYERFTQVVDAASGMKLGVSDAIDSMGSALEGSSFFKVLQGLWKVIQTVGLGIAKVFGSIVDSIANAMGDGNFNGIMDFFNSLVTGGVGIALIKFLKSISEPFEGFSGMMESITGALDGVRGCVEAYQTQLKAGALIKIAAAIAILVASIVVLSGVDSEKLSSALGAITILFADLAVIMSILGKSTGTVNGVASLSTTMVAMSLAVLILASALKKLADLDMKEIATGLVGIAGLTAIVVIAAKALSNGGKKVMKGALQLVLFAAAIKILASACEDLSYLSWEELSKGLIGVGALMAEIVLFTKTANFNAKSMFTAVGIVLLAASIKILASACEDFAYMSWEEIGKGLAAIGGLLAEIIIFTNLTGGAKKVLSTGIALIAIAAAMKIFASAATDIAKLSWEDLSKGLLGMAGALTMVVIALRTMPKGLVSQGVGLIAVATALLILSSALNKMGAMSWEEVGKGLLTLGGSLAILAIGLHAMKGTAGGSASLLIATTALAVMAPVLAILGAMSWSSIAKGLIVIAGAFTVLGIAGLLLKPLTLTILGLAGAFALIGVAVLAIGVGLTAAGVGLSLLAGGIAALATALTAGATAIVAGLSVIILGIIKLIPDIAVAIGKGIIAICQVLADSMPVIGEAIKALVLTLCDVLVECVPVIADTVLKLLSGVLKSLVEYTPQIVDSLMQLLIEVIDGLARNIPKIIQSIMNLIGSIFSGIVDALKSVDTGTLLKGVAAIGIVSLLMGSLASAAALAPAAMVGVLAVGAIIAEMAIVLAAIGALAQLPGLDWLINEGGDLLKSIGNAIGGFIGGIVGGVMEGISSALPQIGTDLSSFMSNAEVFIEGARSIDASTMEGVQALVGIIMALTAANILESLTSWLTGGSSLTKFGEDIAAFGPNLKAYADAVSGIDPAAVKASAEAAKALAEMADIVPNEGGMVAWFAGENSIAKFGTELVELGQGLKGFSDAITGVNPENLLAASTAAKSLAEMSSYIPNSGGMASWFAGESSISKFSGELVTLGGGLKGFSDALTGVNTENLLTASSAAKSLAEMCSYIPNSGGIGAWFAGEQSISKFSEDLVSLGGGLKGFSDAITGVSPESLTAAAGAAQSLAEMCSYIPNSGGIGAWFAGEQSVSKFGTDLIRLGEGLKGFSDNIDGVTPESITAAAGAGKALAEMCSIIPNQGGVAAWFAGEKSISKFAGELGDVGKGLKAFSNEVGDVKPENVSAAASAGKSLADMANSVPGDTSKIVKFGENLSNLGGKLKSYVDKVGGVSKEKANTINSIVTSFKDSTSSLDGSKLKSSADGIEDMVKALLEIKKINSKYADEFKKTMDTLGKTSADAFTDSFKDLDSDMKKIGESAINNLADGVKAKKSEVEKACESMVKACVSAITDQKKKFEAAGKEVARGFANGISFNSYLASQKAKAMAEAAVKAVRRILDINSPSKVFREIGSSVPEGFADGIDKLGGMVTKSSESMATGALDSVRNSISRISDIVANDIDAQPTIRPVLDLSDVRSNAGKIGDMLGGDSAIGVMANVGAISSMMAQRNQNGETGEIVSAINALNKNLKNAGGTTNNYFDGITYDDGSNLADAVETIVRAARIERRS